MKYLILLLFSSFAFAQMPRITPSKGLDQDNCLEVNDGGVKKKPVCAKGDTGRVTIGDGADDDGLFTIQRDASLTGIDAGLAINDQLGTPQFGIGIEGVTTNDVQFMTGQFGDFRFYTGNTNMNTVNGTERVVIEAGGDFGIGTTNPTTDLHIADSFVQFQLEDTDTGQTWGYNINSDDSLRLSRDGAFDHVIYKDSGSILMRSTDNDNATTGTGVRVLGTVADPQLAVVRTSTSGGSTPITVYTGGLFRWFVRGDGGLSNFQSNDVDLSDRRVKENFKKVDEQLPLLKKLKVQRFKYKDMETETIGVVAQQVEKHIPELVSEDWPANKEKTEFYKTIKTTQLYYRMLKGIQELSAKLDIICNNHPEACTE